eukprot:572158-Hanusia_phi.AAC.1
MDALYTCLTLEFFCTCTFFTSGPWAPGRPGHCRGPCQIKIRPGHCVSATREEQKETAILTLTQQMLPYHPNPLPSCGAYWTVSEGMRGMRGRWGDEGDASTGEGSDGEQASGGGA